MTSAQQEQIAEFEFFLEKTYRKSNQGKITHWGFFCAIRKYFKDLEKK